MDELPEISRYREDLNKIESILNSSPRKAEDMGRLIPYHFHNTLEQQFCKMAIAYIREIATSDRIFSDPRNEESHRLCKKIYKLMKENGDDLKYVSIPMI
jgi:ABC-type oligopeptide transport system ATPase subunit